MAIIDGRAQFEATVDTPHYLGATDIEVGTILSEDGLNAGQDYTADNVAGTVTLLHPVEPAIVAFRFRYTDPDRMAPVRTAIEALRATGYDADADRLDQLTNAVTGLRQYLGLASPTLAQSGQALKILIRIVLFMLKRQGY